MSEQKQKKIAQFKSKVCDVALDIFATQPVADTTLEQIAEAIPCDVMLLQRLFHTTDAVLAALRCRGFHQLNNALERVIKADAPRQENTRQLIDVYFSFAMNNHDLYRIIFDNKQENESRYPELYQELERLKAIWKGSGSGALPAGI